MKKWKLGRARGFTIEEVRFATLRRVEEKRWYKLFIHRTVRRLRRELSHISGTSLPIAGQCKHVRLRRADMSYLGNQDLGSHGQE